MSTGLVVQIERVHKKYGLNPSTFLFRYPDGTCEGATSPTNRFLTIEQENEEAIATYVHRLKELKSIASGVKRHYPVFWVCLYDAETYKGG